MKSNRNESLADYEALNVKNLTFFLSKENLTITFIILLLSLLFGYIYYKQKTPVYKSYISIELPERGAENRGAQGLQNIIQNITMPTPMNRETEIDIIKSKRLILKTINIVPMNIRYYKKGTFRKIELENPPFVVKNAILKGIAKVNFILTPIDEKRFKLKIDAKNRKEMIYKYGQKIKMTKGSFVIEKALKNIPKEKYYFTILHEQKVAKEIQKNLSVTPSSLRSSLIIVEYRDSNPRLLKDFLNTLGKVYIEENIKKRTQAASATLEFITKQLKKIKKKLEKSAQALKNFKKNNNILDIATKTRELIDRSVAIKEELSRAYLELQAFKSVKKEFLKGNYSALAAIGNRFPILNNLIERLKREEIEKESLLTEYTPLHPQVIRVDKSIKEIKNSIKKLIKGIETDLEKRKNILEKEYRSYEKEIKSLPKKEQIYANLERDYEVNERLYSYLLNEKSQFSIAKAAKVAGTKIIDYAEIPLKPFSPNKSLVLSVSAFLGLLLSMAIIFFKEKNDPKLKSPSEVGKLSSLPIYGLIPFIKDETAYNKVYVLENPNSKESEIYRKIRTELEFIPPSAGCKTILVTSYVPGERKTVTSANLAAIFGLGNKKTLLISFDFITPQIHKKFSIPNRYGTADLLEKRVKNLDKVIFEHPIYQNLHIIPSGEIPKNRYDLIQSNKTDALFKYLKKIYDYIIVDTPAVDMVSDALLLTRHSDITVFTVRMDFSKKSHIKNVDLLVKKYKIKNAGFIINSIKTKHLNFETYDKGYLYYANY